ncbi:type IV secretion system protein [Hasllibacter sp. MH4015]|uniref:type IV secretion system protein n=1 Tax=Hasllibacter sp. MH4015 TaxID=2854029 RepID=UPI00351D400B
MAERVLGLVISSGVKVLVLAVIVGIGSTIFADFTSGFAGEPTIEDAMSVVLGALALLALGIFGPGIANGIVSGGPQLGAGTAVGTAVAAGGLALGGAAAGHMALGAAGAGVRGASATAGGASTAYQLGFASRSTMAGKAAGGVAAIGKAGVAAATSPLQRSIAESAQSGARAAYAATGGSYARHTNVATANAGPPAWARRMKQQQSIHHGVSTAAHVIRSGDHGGGGSAVSLSERS